MRMPMRWTPLGDNALMRMWTDAVGTRFTPLVGGDARFGWNHLGPWLFYLMAVPYRLLGTSAVGLLAGAALLNVVSVVLVIRCVGAVAGHNAAAIFSIGAVLFLLTARGDRLIDPWNPYVVQLPFLVALVCCWAVLNRRFEWLALLVGAGSLCVQAHIAFVVPVIVLGALAGAAAVRWRAAVSTSHRRRACVVGLVAWLPTAVDLALPGHHNLYRVGRFFVQPSATPTAGMRAGFEVVLRETGLRASWLGGHLGLRIFTEGFNGGVGFLPGLGLVALGATGVWAALRHDRVLGTLVTILAALLPAAVIEIAQARGALFPYLFGWVSIVGMLCWAAAAVAVTQLLSVKSSGVAVWLLRGSAMASALVLAFAGVGESLPRSPRERSVDAAIVRRLVAATEPQLSRSARYQLTHGSDTYNSIYEMGIVDELRHDGYRISVEPQAHVLFGRHMTDSRAATYPAIGVVAPFEQTLDGTQLLALSDPLSPAERSEERQLVASLAADYARTGDDSATRIVRFGDGDVVLLAGFVHPDPAEQHKLERLAALRTRGRPVAVTLAQPA
jgi:hypothetical protein